MSAWTGLCVWTAVALVVSHICSILEAVLYTIPIAEVRRGAETGDRRWKLLLYYKENPGRGIAAVLIFNTVSHTAGATLAGTYAEKLFSDVGVSLFSAALVFCVLWFAEIVPKTIGVVFCRQLGRWTADPILWMVWLSFPLILLSELSTRSILRHGQDDSQISEWELAALLRQGVRDGTFRAREARIVESVLRLDRRRVCDIMTPRTVMTALPADLSLAEAARDPRLLEHSRIPVYDGEPDRVLGFVRRHNVLHHADDPGTLRDLVQEALQAYELMTCDQLLARFLDERVHLATVIDEYGQVEGLVTLEDVLEELLGMAIQDEGGEGPDLREEAERLAVERREHFGVAEPEPQPPDDDATT